jgi:hypothetical protein
VAPSVTMNSEAFAGWAMAGRTWRVTFDVLESCLYVYREKLRAS